LSPSEAIDRHNAAATRKKSCSQNSFVMQNNQPRVQHMQRPMLTDRLAWSNMRGCVTRAYVHETARKIVARYSTHFTHGQFSRYPARGSFWDRSSK